MKSNAGCIFHVVRKKEERKDPSQLMLVRYQKPASSSLGNLGGYEVLA